MLQKYRSFIPYLYAETKCRQHSVLKAINTRTYSTQCVSISTHITAYLYVVLSVNTIPSFMLSQKALHIILDQSELSNGISSCQGILSVYRRRNVRQRVCVPLCQVSCCSCCPSFKEEINKISICIHTQGIHFRC